MGCGKKAVEAALTLTLSRPTGEGIACVEANPGPSISVGVFARNRGRTNRPQFQTHPFKPPLLC